MPSSAGPSALSLLTEFGLVRSVLGTLVAHAVLTATSFLRMRDITIGRLRLAAQDLISALARVRIVAA